MGNCISTPSGFQTSPEALKQNKAIDAQLRQDEKKLATEVKMLLLGPGSSGKSTILKQMKVIYLQGFTQAEKESYRQQIFRNVVEAMRSIWDYIPQDTELEGLEIFESSRERRSWADVEQSPDGFLAAELGGKDKVEWYTELLTHPPDLAEQQTFPVEFYEPLSKLWETKSIQRIVSRGSDDGIVPDNMLYFYENLGRLFDSAYIPTDQDILRCRQKTTGITETRFRSAALQYRLFDVGGQRSERKKWIHCFENVTCVLFLAAISGYDQALVEDKDSNQMQEALMLFDSICNSQWFVKTSIILFLNKVDIFKERILVSSIKAYFPDYDGDERDYNASREYFKARFTRLNRSQEKDIYASFTTAIDTDLIKVVMASVYDIIVTRNLNEINLL